MTRRGVLFLACLISGARLEAQAASIAASAVVDVGWGVDTTRAPNHEIFQHWRAYLADRPDSARRNHYWSTAQQQRWPTVDLAAPWVFQDADWFTRVRTTVVELRPTLPGEEDEYVIRTLFSSRDANSGAIRPLALLRVFVVREAGQWRLSTALPHLTRDWREERVGPITFVSPPTRRFSREKARRSARFVDSLAAAFAVRRPTSLRYYVAGTPDELGRILGLDFAIYAGGRAYVQNGLILSGLPTYDEFYPHELAHVVLSPLTGGAPWLLDEGLATWVGGSRGRDFHTLVNELDAELRRDSALALDSILAPHAWTDSVSYTAAAVLLKMAHDKGGLPALRSLLRPRTGVPEDIRETAARILAIVPSRLGAEWRRAVARYAITR